MSKCVLRQLIIFYGRILNNFPWNHMLCSKANYKLSTTTCPPTLLLVSQSSNLNLPTPCQTRGLTHGTKQQPCGRHNDVYLIGKSMPTPRQKLQLTISRRLFLLKSGILSFSWGRNQITSTSRIFSMTNVNCT
jgi:hypothetical protein